MSVISLSDDFQSKIWNELKLYVRSNTPNVSTQVLYMCYYCKRMIKGGKMPARCVLNGLQTVPIPPELDQLSRQRAKYYQTVVRLGTYTGKVPTYDM